MKTACSHCGAQHSLPEAQLGGHSRVQFRCGKCGKATVVDLQTRPDATHAVSPVPQFARSQGAPRLAGSMVSESPLLPGNNAVTLSVISGPSRGIVHLMEKARVVLGRADADLTIPDVEVSRWHCSIEIQNEVVRLRDLESTNGTYVGNERVRVAELKHLSEFRIGSSVILVSIAPRSEP